MDGKSTVTSTYRIQFSPYFTFGDALQLVTYLKELGISHVYSSPIMEAVPGSVHGYDVTDFSRIRQELGGEADFKKLNKTLRENGIGWVQDFVPNHMAMDTRNPYIRDILEKGRGSPFAGFFDIDWDHPAFSGGKLCLPFLEKPYYTELKSGSFSFGLGNGIVLMYKDIEIPVSRSSYQLLLGSDLAAKALQMFQETEDGSVLPRPREYITDLEEMILEISEKLEISGKDINLVDSVVSMQNYSLRYWRSTAYETNYRRFFAVNGLICLREEDPEVFGKVHEKLLSLIRSGDVDGIRIDHVDGLFNPEGYLRNLREAAGDLYIIVEKILEQDESLNEDWPIQGTSGYDFLGRVTSLMCPVQNSHNLDTVYRDFSGYNYEESSIIYSSKLNAIDKLFPAVLDSITSSFWKGISKLPYGRDSTFHGMRDAIREILAHTPVYRTYITRGDPSGKGLTLLNSIIQVSRGFRPDLSSYFDAIEMFISQYNKLQDAGIAIQILQQYMPAILAKSVEDTLLFTYNRLISLNDVGINPFHAPNSVASFHDFNTSRMQNTPLSMNALSTHDTKLSEDIRARISVLSEIPLEWNKTVQYWHNTNSRYSAGNNGGLCPSKNEEYYIYQLLLGSYPFSDGEHGKYKERLLGHLIKSIREAAVSTNWEKPDHSYEKQYTDFVNALLDHSLNAEFVEDFMRMHSLVSFHGFLNSITQKILQMTSPGIPDTYQGTEIWNFNFVDPDNRRKVNFRNINDLHRKVMTEFALDRGVVGRYLNEYADGRIKLLVTSVILNLRRNNPDLFLKGSYLPILVEGPFSDNLVAFSRSFGKVSLLVVVPRLTTSLGRMQLPVGKSIWSGNFVIIPKTLSGSFEDVFTGRVQKPVEGGRIEIGELFSDAPFSVMISRNEMPHN